MDISHICARVVVAHLYVCIKIKIVKKKSRIVYFFIRKDRILRGRKERVTVWFWLAGHSCKGKLKNRKKEKKIP
jgi:hypothetical protein